MSNRTVHCLLSAPSPNLYVKRCDRTVRDFDRIDPRHPGRYQLPIKPQSITDIVRSSNLTCGTTEARTRRQQKRNRSTTTCSPPTLLDMYSGAWLFSMALPFDLHPLSHRSTPCRPVCVIWPHLDVGEFVDGPLASTAFQFGRSFGAE